jgi:pimeloyl-ACP methyl ester carboxylesterase
MSLFCEVVITACLGKNDLVPKATVHSTDNRLIEIEYATFGSPSNPAILMIMGYTAQMIVWPQDFCQLLADAGYFVIIFDNRDCGLSTHLDGVVVDTGPIIMAAMTDQPIPPIPYSLSDMATDAVGVLDHLGIERAHVIGMSLGGMIAQVVAYEHRHRTMTLTSISSQPGDPDVGQPSMDAAMVIFADPLPTTSREDYIASSTQWQVWQSKKYRSDELSYAAAAASYDRAFYPEGAPRQLAAVYGSGRRHEQVATISCPTLVIHGTDDQLIVQSGSERTAELIPGSKLLLIDDMGHDLPQPLWPILTGAILEHVAQVVA